MLNDHEISVKANRVLNILFLALVLIFIRVWYLSVSQHDHYLQLSRKPQVRTVIEQVERATIRDRFNIPLAMNKIQYNAGILYGQIKQIPSVTWKKDPSGKKIKTQPRSEHITLLSKKLGDILDMNPAVIEDLIHCRASLFPQTPFVIKENITEKQYYLLRMLEKDFLGIHTQKSSKRVYPQGKLGCDVLGYMGAIHQKQYQKIATETKELQNYLAMREAGEFPFLPVGFSTPMEVKERLIELQEKAYTINDLVGKAGVESVFDEELRGFYGKKQYEVDVKGNFLRELPGSRKMIAGQRILLSISSELQEYAEKLLSQYDAPLKKGEESRFPWIKGGAIVAMLPQTGEIVTLASYPRFDPNDFAPSQDFEKKRQKEHNILQWIESEAYIAEVWDGKRPLSKEYYNYSKNTFEEVTESLSWDYYLQTILAPSTSIKKLVQSVSDINTIFFIQQEMQSLLTLSGQDSMSALVDTLFPNDPQSSNKTSAEQKQEIAEHLDKNIEYVHERRKYINGLFSHVAHNDDKILFLDLCKLVVAKDRFSVQLLEKIGKESISEYRGICRLIHPLEQALYQKAQAVFHETDFKVWREASFKDYLKEKRIEEKKNKKYPKPYLDYAEAMERKMFKEFWLKNRLDLLLQLLGKADVSSDEIKSLQTYGDALTPLQIEFSSSLQTLKKHMASLDSALTKEYLATMRPFKELNDPLYGKYKALPKRNGMQLEKDLAAAFYPKNGLGYGKSQAFRQSTPLGSVYKLVVAYQALVERYESMKELNESISLTSLNPLIITDQMQGSYHKTSGRQIMGYSEKGEAIPRMYKGGMLPRVQHNIGRIDLKGALEQSSNIYFSLLAGEHIQDPQNLIKASKEFGFGEKTGIELPGEIRGILPDDLSYNRTGLYAFAIGQHSLVVTPLQSAVMMGSLANNGSVLTPKIVQVMAGKEPQRELDRLFATKHYPFQNSLSLVGIDFPLFTEALQGHQKSSISYTTPDVKRSIFLPEEVRHMLFEGMELVINGPRGTARPGTFARGSIPQEFISNYTHLQHQLIAKTGTAQILHKQTLDSETSAEMMTHVGFAGISYPEARNWENPELVVIVYLRFAKSGREGAPLAAQIVKKWREICSKHGQASYVLPPKSIISKIVKSDQQAAQ
ncbi:MAG: hypothetical protein HKM07_02440 [Chlamydiae bacterium]|nr:hypothetical protein [Chlamydiota bacterium]